MGTVNKTIPGYWGDSLRFLCLGISGSLLRCLLCPRLGPGCCWSPASSASITPASTSRRSVSIIRCLDDFSV